MKRLLIILILLIPLLTSCASPADTPEEAWGDLEASEGEVTWNTLTEEQQEDVNYPEFDENSVYWTPNGGSYHAVDWCYTLSRSKTIINGTLDEACDNGKTDPCSKCVGH